MHRKALWVLTWRRVRRVRRVDLKFMGEINRTFFWTTTDLANTQREYQTYYNEHRCHSGRDGATPAVSKPRGVIDIRKYEWQKHCRRFIQLSVAA